VRDSRGEPVANARVLAGSDAYPEFEQSPDGVVTTRPAARCVRTDAQGEFRFDGLVAGRLPVQVRSTEHAPWSGEVELVESLASSLDIALIDGAVLTGFVRKASGEPVEGAEVWYGEPQSFVATVCTTDADGTYALRGLPPGELAIDVDAGSEGKAHAQLFAAAGATLRWDAVLSAGLVLRGRVVAPGRELDGWMVAAQTMGARSERWFVGTSMDSDGRFYIDDCPDRPLRVVLSHQDSGWLARAIVEGVRAGGAELVLEPDPALEPSVHLRGRIVDADGQPLPGAWFRPCHAKQDGQPLLAADVDGRFELGPYPPGEWTIRVQAGNLCSNSPTHAFAAGETWDFGDVHAELGGQVLVELDGACGAPGAATSVRMFDDTGWSEYLTVEGDRARSLINAAGRYTLSVEREGCGRLEREIEVRSGEETRVVVELSSK
jgi:protocatechuate 3,4-dioxygenase beta subunit